MSMSFGYALAFIKVLNLDQQKTLADKLGITPQAVNNWRRAGVPSWREAQLRQMLRETVNND